MKHIKIRNLFFVLALMGLFFSGCKKKEGCTDPLSTNFDPDAVEDDGSCIYANTTIYEDLGNGMTRVEDRGEGTGTMTWTSNKVWLLDGFVFVNSGQTLTIEPGTVIKGEPGAGGDASALIVANGGRIVANGTAQSPIIFTAKADDVSDPADIQEGTRGLWGGLIILGDATLNSTPGSTQIEGLPITEERGLYGGNNDMDDSGILRYVSVRYGGTDIGSGNEINGVTFGGVGSGTVVEHVEVVFNQDDGYEFFGGTVNTKWLVAAFCADDAFDYDEGFRGKGQFWFAIQSESDGDRGGEHDGGTTPEDGSPYSRPMIYNSTYIGRGELASKRCITFRDNAGGEYHNSIFIEYGLGVDIELLSSGEHSYARFEADELKMEGNAFYNVAGNDPAAIFTVSAEAGINPTDSANAATALMNYFTSAGNSVTDPQIAISRTADGGLNPVPANNAVLSGATPSTDMWYEQVTYKGAFSGSNWLSGWSFLDTQGYL